MSPNRTVHHGPCTLRPASVADAAGVAHVLLESRRVFLPYAPHAHTQEEVRGWVAGHLLPTGHVTVVTTASHIIGVLALSEDDEAAWIDQLYMLPGFEGRGWGTRLLAVAHAAQRRPIRLYTFAQNHQARRFYERHGYRPLRFSDGLDNEERCPDVLYELSGNGLR